LRTTATQQKNALAGDLTHGAHLKSAPTPITTKAKKPNKMMTQMMALAISLLP
jgi:hypothetical protein